MTDRSFPLRPDADLEAALRGLADAIDWPAAGPSAGGRNGSGGRRPRPDRGRRRTGPGPWVVRRVRLVATGPPAARHRPGGRADADRACRAGGRRRARLAGPPAHPRGPVNGPSLSPPPTVAPSSTPAGAPGSRMGLGTRVDLADLDAQAGFPVRWPSDPALGPPDAAYIDPSKNGQVALVWAARPDLPATLEPGVGLVLTAFRGAVDDGFFNKVIATAQPCGGSGSTTDPPLAERRAALAVLRERRRGRLRRASLGWRRIAVGGRPDHLPARARAGHGSDRRAGRIAGPLALRRFSGRSQGASPRSDADGAVPPRNRSCPHVPITRPRHRRRRRPRGRGRRVHRLRPGPAR